MPMPPWPTRTWAWILALLAAVGVLADGASGFRVLAEVQPLATKGWVLAQYHEVGNQIVELRWDQLATRAAILERQVSDDEFKLIQLQVLIDADPDPTKTEVRRNLQRAIESNSRELRFLRCQLMSRRDGRTCSQ